MEPQLFLFRMNYNRKANRTQYESAKVDELSNIAMRKLDCCKAKCLGGMLLSFGFFGEIGFCRIDRGGFDGAVDLPGARFDDLHAMGAAEFRHRQRGELVGDEHVDLRDMTDAHRRRALELQPVGDEKDLAGIVDDRLA